MKISHKKNNNKNIITCFIDEIFLKPFEIKSNIFIIIILSDIDYHILP
jgi:hypothetical protein